MRCTQTKERLTAMAVIYSYYETDVDINIARKCFIEKHPCRLECANMKF